MSENFKIHVFSQFNNDCSTGKCKRCKKQLEKFCSDFYTAENPLKLKEMTVSQAIAFYWSMKYAEDFLHAGNRAAFEEISTLMEIK